MAKLFVDQTIEIEAPAATVWKVLTKSAFTRQWAPDFAQGAPFYIESDWELDGPVLWKDGAGAVVVAGEVTALESHKRLRFTVFDIRAERPAVTAEDGITLELTERDGLIRLHVRQGDFGVMAEGQKYRDITDATWGRVLPKVRALAEAGTLEKFLIRLAWLQQQQAQPERH